MRNLELLGSNMVAAGEELNLGENYRSALIKCGRTQTKLGQIEREFATKADLEFVRPLKKFLEEDAKALMREKRHLEVKRLDLDAAKNKSKKLRSQAEPHSDQTKNEIKEVSVKCVFNIIKISP